jgi:phage gpG-like protein
MNAAEEVARNLAVLAARAETTAPREAVKAMGEAYGTAVRAVLTARSHEAGTPTPAAPGQPPATISGDLAASIEETPPILVSPGIATLAIGSDLIYAPVHEWGATISAKTAPYLKFQYGGGWNEVTSVKIPPRPFMAATTLATTRSRVLSRVAAAAWIADLST